MPNYITNLTPDEKQQLQDIQAETDALFKEYRRIIENIPAEGIEAYFGSIDGQARFERIRKLTDRQTHIKENALKREIAAAGADPDKLFSCAITYLKNVTAFITLDMIYENVPAGVTMISDFSRSLREETALYMQALESCPEYKAKLETAVRKTAAAYPKVFTVYPDTYITEFDEKIRAADAPTFREQNKGSFFKKTAFGEIYITTKPARKPKANAPSGALLEKALKENMFLNNIASANSLIANDLFKKPLGERIDRKETSKKRKGSVKTYSTAALLEWNPQNWQLLDKSGAPFKLLSQHRAVMDIIYSLKAKCDEEEKTCVISPAEIYRNLTGSNDPNSKVSKGIAGEIDNIINILAACRLSANLEEELKERGIKGSGKIIQHLLLIDGELEITYRNGSKSKGYEVVKPPILGRYSERLDQITRIPPEMLAFDDERTTIERLGIIYYIARRVMQMHIGQSKRIKLDSIIENTVENAENITRKKRYMIFEFAEKYLDYLKRTGFVSSYAIYYEGKKTGGFDIEPAPKKLTDSSKKD